MVFLGCHDFMFRFFICTYASGTLSLQMTLNDLTLLSVASVLIVYVNTTLVGPIKLANFEERSMTDLGTFFLVVAMF